MNEKDPLSLDRQLCFPLYAASRELIKRYRPWLEELDLTYTQYIAMLVLWEVREISVKELGRRLYLDSGTLTPLLKSMEGKGYLRRRRSTADERVLLAELTAEGEALRERAIGVPGNVAACLELNSEEAKTLYCLLYKLLQNMK